MAKAELYDIDQALGSQLNTLVNWDGTGTALLTPGTDDDLMGRWSENPMCDVDDDLDDDEAYFLDDDEDEDDDFSDDYDDDEFEEEEVNSESEDEFDDEDL